MTTGSGRSSSVSSAIPPTFALITDDPTIIVLGGEPLTGKKTDRSYKVNARLLSVIFIILSGSAIAAIIS